MVSDVVTSARINIDEVCESVRLIANKLPALIVSTKEAAASTKDMQASSCLISSIKDVTGGVQKLLILIKVGLFP